jgi:hypothetical protein
VHRALKIGLGSAAALMALGASLLYLALDVPQPMPAPERGAAFSRVTLVEPAGNRIGPVSLRVADSRIAAIGAPTPRLTDEYADAIVLPGLTDMHAHFPATGFPGDDTYTALLFLLHGVTTVRLTGQVSPETIANWRERVTSGVRAGPRFYTCGPIIDGPNPVIPGSVSIRSAAQARSTVAEWAGRGVDCIKAYDHLDLATVTALREAAHEHGLPIVGHTPQSVSFEQARLDDVQHLRGVHPPFRDEPLSYPQFLRVWKRLDQAWIERAITVSRRHGIAHTPTLVAVEATVASRRWPQWRKSAPMQLWLPHMRDALWSGEVGFSPARFASHADLETVSDATRAMARMVGALYEAKVPIHTGTDANAPNLVPGASLWRELRLLVNAGLTPDQALAASTRASPRFLGLPDAGRLHVGDSADLVLFREDPTRDIAALESMIGVVRDGRLYSKRDLEERLGRFRDHYSGFAFDRVLMPAMRSGLRALTAWLRSGPDVSADVENPPTP